MTFDVYLLIFCARTMKSRCRFELGLFIKYFMLKCNKELFSLLNIFLCGLEFSSHQTDIQMGDLNHWHVFSYFGLRIDIYTTISFRDIYIYYNIFFENIFVDLHQRPNKCRHFIHFTFHFKYIKASLINGTFESYIQKHQKLKFSNLKNIHVRGKLKSFAFMTVMDGAER